MLYKIIKLSVTAAMLLSSTAAAFAQQSTSYKSVEYKYSPDDDYNNDDSDYYNNSSVNYKNNYYSREAYNDKLNQKSQGSDNFEFQQGEPRAFIGITGSPIVWAKSLGFDIKDPRLATLASINIPGFTFPLDPIKSYKAGIIIGIPFREGITFEAEAIYGNINVAIPDLTTILTDLNLIDRIPEQARDYLKAKPSFNMKGAIFNLAWQLNLTNDLSPILAVGAGVVNENLSMGMPNQSSLSTWGLITQGKIGVAYNLTEDLIIRGDYEIGYIANKVWSKPISIQGANFTLPSFLYHGPKLTLAMKLDI